MTLYFQLTLIWRTDIHPYYMRHGLSDEALSCGWGIESGEGAGVAGGGGEVMNVE